MVDAHLSLPAPTPLPVAIAMGEETTCLVRDDGLVVCSGALSLSAELPGRLEVSDREICGRARQHVTCLRPGSRRELPTPFAELVRGPGAPCGLTWEGGAYCFASTAGDEADAEVVEIALPSPATELGADGGRIYARLEDGTVWTWPPSGHGLPLVAVRVAEGVSRIASQPWTRLCAADARRVRCWVAGREERPRPLPGVEALAVGRDHVCASNPDGVACWGAGATPPPPLRRPVALGAGDDRTCAIDEGRLVCWP